MEFKCIGLSNLSFSICLRKFEHLLFSVYLVPEDAAEYWLGSWLWIAASCEERETRIFGILPPFQASCSLF